MVDVANKDPIAVLVVDDHEVVREGLRHALNSIEYIRVVGEAGSAAEAMKVLGSQPVDLVVTDYRLPDESGAVLCRRIVDRFSNVRVVFLTTYLNENIVRQSFAAGAAAFVTKASGLGELRRVLAELWDGTPLEGTTGSASTVRRLHMRSDPRPDTLTPRQETVLRLLSEGLTYEEIAKEVSISSSTVRFHVQSMKDRLGVRTRAELIAAAVRDALLSPSED